MTKTNPCEHFPEYTATRDLSPDEVWAPSAADETLRQLPDPERPLPLTVAERQERDTSVDEFIKAPTMYAPQEDMDFVTRTLTVPVGRRHVSHTEILQLFEPRRQTTRRTTERYAKAVTESPERVAVVATVVGLLQKDRDPFATIEWFATPREGGSIIDRLNSGTAADHQAVLELAALELAVSGNAFDEGTHGPF